MLQLVCDGCGMKFDSYDDPAITGKRADDRRGDELPEGRFDWCRKCAVIAFKAVRQIGWGGI